MYFNTRNKSSYMCIFFFFFFSIADASTLHLNGTQQMSALMPEDSRTQAEEIVVRFKTTRPRGLLLATNLDNSPDRLEIYLEEGKAHMLIHIGDREKV